MSHMFCGHCSYPKNPLLVFIYLHVTCMLNINPILCPWNHGWNGSYPLWKGCSYAAFLPLRSSAVSWRAMTSNNRHIKFNQADTYPYDAIYFYINDIICWQKLYFLVALFLGDIFFKAKTPQDSPPKTHQHPPFFAVWIFSTQSAFRQLSTLFDRWKRRFLSLGKRQVLEKTASFGGCGAEIVGGAW